MYICDDIVYYSCYRIVYRSSVFLPVSFTFKIIRSYVDVAISYAYIRIRRVASRRRVVSKLAVILRNALAGNGLAIKNRFGEKITVTLR